MNNPFSFHSPVRTYMNEDFDTILIKLIGDAKNIAVVSGATSIHKTGFKDTIESLCVGRNILFFNQIEENPSINTIIKGGRELHKHKTDIVVAFGGGSAIDAAKAMALFSSNRGGFYEVFNSSNLKPALPVIAIPTTCGTGSEMNSYAIITDFENKDKINLSKDSMFPVAAILEPKFLKTLNKEFLMSTVFDAFTHAFEGYLSQRSNPFADAIALNSIDIILKAIKKSRGFEELTDDILCDFLYASSLAGIVILHTGTTLLHAMGNYLTNHKKIHHGKANAILLSSYVRLCREYNVTKIDAVDKIFLAYDMCVDNFTNKYYVSEKITEIIPLAESEPFIRYAIGKSNAKSSLFPIEFEKVKQALYQ